jgi:hypothetical protein
MLQNDKYPTSRGRNNVLLERIIIWYFRNVNWYKFSDVSEKRIASIFTGEK